jgi:hypothetical protein
MTYATQMGLVATHTKFHKDWFRHSKIDRRGYIDTQRARRLHKPTLAKQTSMYIHCHMLVTRH